MTPRKPVITASSVRPVPNKPKTPLHSFRVEDDVWEAAQAKAKEQGTDLSKVLRAYLKRYIGRQG